jgi:hypothetical protein
MAIALAGAGSGVAPAMREACADELKYAAGFYLNATVPAYDLMLPDEIQRFRQYGWFFPQSNAYILLMALAGNALPDGRTAADIYQAIHVTWDYLLGANPGGHSLITGFGAQRMRAIVDNDSANDGIELPVPGIPLGLASGPSWISRCVFARRGTLAFMQNHAFAVVPLEGDGVPLEGDGAAFVCLVA